MLVGRTWSAEEIVQEFKASRPVEVFHVEGGMAMVRSVAADPQLIGRGDPEFIGEWTARQKVGPGQAALVGALRVFALACGVALVRCLANGSWLSRLSAGVRTRATVKRAAALATVLAVVKLGAFLFPAITRPDGAWQLGWRYLLSPGMVHTILAQAGAPGSGASVLPVRVQAMIALLKEQHAVEYRYSPGIEGDIELKQRLVEGSYPLRYRRDARLLVLLEQETAPGNCHVVSQAQGVAVARCP
jgi:hypothetical protein